MHLTPEQRDVAPVLHRALIAARDGWAAGERVRRGAADAGCGPSWPRSHWPRVDYVSVADGLTLRELDRVDGPALLSLAVSFGTTRLIDNVLLGD